MIHPWFCRSICSCDNVSPCIHAFMLYSNCVVVQSHFVWWFMILSVHLAMHPWLYVPAHNVSPCIWLHICDRAKLFWFKFMIFSVHLSMHPCQSICDNVSLCAHASMLYVMTPWFKYMIFSVHLSMYPCIHVSLYVIMSVYAPMHPCFILCSISWSCLAILCGFKFMILAVHSPMHPCNCDYVSLCVQASMLNPTSPLLFL